MNVTVPDVLGSLFNPTDTVCFRVFDDKKDGIFQGAKLSCECGKYKSIEETLKNHNAANRGIFFVVNYGGQDDASITRINAQFVEMDNDSFEDQQKKINAFPLPPSMIIRTQKSYHVLSLSAVASDTVGVCLSYDGGATFSEEQPMADFLQTVPATIWDALPGDRKLVFRFVLHDNDTLTNFIFKFENPQKEEEE